MAFIIKIERKLFFSIKKNRLLITKNISTKISDNKPLLVTDLNINIAFKVAKAGFIKMNKFTYIITEVKNTIFVKTSFIKSDISFAKNNQYTILCFK